MSTLERHSVTAEKGFYVPAGTVLSLGTGLLVAEFQQNSDTTYRIYDYDRVGLDGKPRSRHLEQALQVIQPDSASKPVRPEQGRLNVLQPLCRSTCCAVDVGTCHGSWALETSPSSLDSLPGAVVLVPAALGRYELSGDLRFLLSALAVTREGCP